MNINFFLASAVIFGISFVVTYYTTPHVIRRMRELGIVSPDMNKKGKPKVAKWGGISMVLGFSLAVLVSLQLSSASLDMTSMLAAICSVILISFLGLMDDVLEIPDRYRVLLPAFAALPLMVTKAGVSTMSFIFFSVNFNLGVHTLPVLGPVTINLFPILLIPIGVVACSNLVNLLAGFNGLEAGSGMIISIFAFLAAAFLYSEGFQTMGAGYLLIALFGCTMAFLFFNRFPAQVFAGNVTTYLIGATLVAAAVIGNMERVGAILLMPQIIEFFLKATSGFQAENFGRVDSKGRLHYEGKIHSLTHIVMKWFTPTEPQLVGILLMFQALFGLLAIASIFV